MAVSEQVGPRPQASKPAHYIIRWLPALVLFGSALTLYVSTAAPGTLFGDPSEYQFIPAILGIAHPPGYALYTLLARVWQSGVHIGTIAFRTNLFAAFLGAVAVALVYLIAFDLLSELGWGNPSTVAGAALGAAGLSVAADFWQHSIHANAHILSAVLGLVHLWWLVRWWRTRMFRWLAGFVFTLALAATHHPVTWIGVPAYLLFVLCVRPRLWREWRTLFRLALCFAAGLLPFLYYPLRSPSAPFGPTDMRTWAGFWRHATAQGLRVNLFHFGLADQPDRLIVFCSLLRLQFALPLIALIGLGLVLLVRHLRKPVLLLGGFVLCHLAFTLNTVQDVMAYLLLPFSALAVFLGVGAGGVVSSLCSALRSLHLKRWSYRLVIGGLLVFLFALPVSQACTNLRRGISLRGFAAAEEYVSTVHARFSGRRERAQLLSDWEHLTPLWVHAYTQRRPLHKQDVQLIFVSTSKPWVPSVLERIEKGPVYLPDYRPSVAAAGFRLVPDGRFYRVVSPPAQGFTPTFSLDTWVGGRVHLLGYDLASRVVRAGEWVELTLYQSAPVPFDGIWMPYAVLGPVQARWTTDSRLLTPHWLPNETVVERYEIPVPFNLPPGEYPLSLGYADLTGGRSELYFSDRQRLLQLTTITVLPPARPPSLETLDTALANLDNQIALMDAWVWAGGDIRKGVWEDALRIRPGQTLRLILKWRALTSPRESQTVFIHILDAAGQYVIGHDYTPLGGACPTYLWFPKWLPGQELLDPYRLVLPKELPAGTYWLEVGMYGMTSLRRLPVIDSAGNLAGDRVLLGPLQVGSE